MLCSRFASSSSRGFINIARRKYLSAAFSLEKEWAARHAELTKLGLGGDYEWISAVQKKFIGGGTASAVDVDAAVCVAEHKDQVDDVLELVYKLRHSENAADLPASAEYALVRLLMKHDPDIIFKLAQDPINYGIFLNEHSACLSIDFFLKRENIQGAARLSAWVMQQEMTNSELLNLLGLYACTRWAELPIEEQTVPTQEVDEEEDISEDDMRTFKFPYLKNPWNDSHFDLELPSHLIGKTLLWLGRDSKSIDNNMKESIKLLGAVLYNRLDLALSLVSNSIDGSVAALVRSRLETSEPEEPNPLHEKIIAGLANCSQSEVSLSERILNQLNETRAIEEPALAAKQKEKFDIWNKRREELVRAQAERVLLKVRAEEIARELEDLDHQNEKLFFFENRLNWEKRANDNKAITEEAARASS